MFILPLMHSDTDCQGCLVGALSRSAIHHDVLYMRLLPGFLTVLLEVCSYTCSIQTEKREVESGRQRGVLLQTYSN